MKSTEETHTLCITQVDKNRQRPFYKGIGAGEITGLQILFAIALKAEPQGYRHIPNIIVS